MPLNVATTDGLYALANGAGSGPDAFAGRDVTAIAQSGGETWALLDGRDVTRRGPDGGWIEIGVIDRGAGKCLLPAAFGVLVGTSEAHLVQVADDRVAPIDAFDRVPGRDAWFTPWGGPPDTRSLAQGPEGTVYANVHVGGIVRSSDGGDTWEPTIAIQADVHQVAAHRTRDGLVLAASARGLCRSDDAGSTWRYETRDLHARYARAVAVVDDLVFLSVSRGPWGPDAALYRRPLDEDAPFERCREGLPESFDGNIDSGSLAAEGATVVFGTEDGSVYRSTDRGASWNRIAHGLPAVRWVALG
jgi:hypothetical protein